MKMDTPQCIENARVQKSKYSYFWKWKNNVLPLFFLLNMNKYISFLAAQSTDPIILALYYGPVLVNEQCKKNQNKINQSKKKKTYLPWPSSVINSLSWVYFAVLWQHICNLSCQKITIVERIAFISGGYIPLRRS